MKDIKRHFGIPVFELVVGPLFNFVYHMLSNNINGKLNPIKTRWKIQYNPWCYSLFSKKIICSKQWWCLTTNNTGVFIILFILDSCCMWIDIIRIWNLWITNSNKEHFFFFFLSSGNIRTIQLFIEIFLSCSEVFLANYHQEQTISWIWMFVLQI